MIALSAGYVRSRSALALLMLAFTAACSQAAPKAPVAPSAGPRAEATFAGGCFWCTESDFDHIPGVISTTAGYTGGEAANPTYKQVSAGGTGHIEAVRIVYDPNTISYASLVARFFRTIDPLDAGGQFCDRGYQYKSAIFVANDDQRRVAEAATAKAAAVLKKPIATEILPAAHFYAAESYHQDYYEKNPTSYKFYRFRCERDARLKQVWGSE